MRWLRKLISTLLLIPLVVLLLGQLTVVTVRATVLQPAFAKERLQASVYIGLQDLIATRIVADLKGAPVQFTAEEARSLVRQVLPADRLRAAVEPLIDHLYTWLLGTGYRPILTVDLRAIRAEVPSAVRALVNARIAALPPCGPGQIPSIDGGFPSCRPEGPLALAMQAAVDAALSDTNLLGAIPEQLDLTAQIEAEQGQAVWRQFDAQRLALRTVDRAGVLGWVPVLVLGMLLGLLNRDRLPTALGWLGWPALITGLAFAGAAQTGAGRAMALPPGPDPQATAILGPLWRDAVSGVATVAVRWGFITASAGLVLLLVRFVLSRSRAAQSPPGLGA